MAVQFNPVKHVRWLVRSDMRYVLDLENRSFDWPWSESDFLAALRARNCIGIVAADEDNLPLGFIIYRIQETAFHVLNLAVEFDARGLGVGRQLIAHLAHKCDHAQRRKTIVAMVHDRNLDAQKFFRAVGFRAVGIERGFFDRFDPAEDAFYFAWKSGTDEERERLYRRLAGELRRKA